MLDILLDAIIDTLKLLPFLYITYLVMETLEHKTGNKTKHAVKKSEKAGPIIGALLGIFPQCGFSVSATNLYAARVISLGTLIAIYLSTSDEMIPIFISEAVSLNVIITVLLIKIIVGMLAGLLIDFVAKKFVRNDEEKIEEICEHDHCHCDTQNIFLSALYHTLNIALFVFLITLLVNGLISIIGDEKIANLVLDRPILGPILACLVGLIPNCAGSVILAQLYIKGVISLATMVAGLLASSGVGILVLFKTNKNIKENIFILALLYIISVFVGIMLEFIF